MTTTHPTVIGVHLDLKGLAFRPGYLPQYLADLAEQGVNTLLVEYEDVFPFHGIDIADDPKVVWSRRTLKHFLDTAAGLNIDVIPLQQCLGHLEYLFRIPRYRKHALNPAYPSTLKLGDGKGRALVRDMLEQVITAHPHSRLVHLGMDEARGMADQAKGGKGDVLQLFLDYLDELCDVVHGYGRTPVIWTDMLEDNFHAGMFDRFRDRVVFMPWDYHTAGPRTPTGRIGGQRVSRQWLNDPAAPDAPPIYTTTRYIEDLPPATRKLIKPTLHGRMFDSLPQVDLWTKLGFQVIGGTAIRASADGPAVPLYKLRYANINTWADAIRRTNQRGLIATSWARGTTFIPPNYPVELAWPLVHHLAAQLGAKPRPFWRGIPAGTLRRITLSLGKCRENWTIEGQLIDEMTALTPKVKTHRFEWDALILLTRAMGLRRRAESNIAEVEYFHANCRLIPAEWQRRLNDQASTLQQLRELRRAIRAHFRQRYHGQAFDEWIRNLFDLHEAKLKRCQVETQAKLRTARSSER